MKQSHISYSGMDLDYRKAALMPRLICLPGGRIGIHNAAFMPIACWTGLQMKMNTCYAGRNVSILVLPVTSQRE